MENPRRRRGRAGPVALPDRALSTTAQPRAVPSGHAEKPGDEASPRPQSARRSDSAHVPEEFRRQGHAAIDWIADYWARLDDLPVLAQVAPGDVRRALPAGPAGAGRAVRRPARRPRRAGRAGPDALAAPALLRLLPGQLVAGGDPRRPALQRHRRAGDDLGDQPGGHRDRAGRRRLARPGARPARAVPLTRPPAGAAESSRTPRRPRPSPPCWPRCTPPAAGRVRDAGLGDTRWTVYGSSQAHSSLVKAAMMAGLGSESVRMVDVDPATQAMDVRSLERMLAEDIDDGCRPVFVQACVGTTSTGAVDDVQAIAEALDGVGAWLHVDAAWAGVAAVLPGAPRHPDQRPAPRRTRSSPTRTSGCSPPSTAACCGCRTGTR